MSDEVLTEDETVGPSDDFLARLAQEEQFARQTDATIALLFAAPPSRYFSDAIMARTRGLVRSLARQLSEAERETDNSTNSSVQSIGRISRYLENNEALLRHCHALTLEHSLLLRLQQIRGADPILPPVIRECLSDDKESTASLAMRFVASQGKFLQSLERMHLPLSQLPADILHEVLRDWRNSGSPQNAAAMTASEAQIRNAYDERNSRAALLERLATIVTDTGNEIFQLEKSGLSLFVSLLSDALKQEREEIVRLLDLSQTSRLALALHAVGKKRRAVLADLAYLSDEHAEAAWSGEIDQAEARALYFAEATQGS